MSLHLSAILQFAQIVIPVAGGVWIAWMAFRWNRRKEHQQWVRDQSRAEWKELIREISTIEHEIPVKTTGLPEHENLGPIIMSVLPVLRGTLFIYPALESSGFIAKWEEFLRYASGEFSLKTSTSRAVQLGTLGDPVGSEDIARWHEIGSEQEVKVRRTFHSLLSELRTLANQDLNM